MQLTTVTDAHQIAPSQFGRIPLNADITSVRVPDTIGSAGTIQSSGTASIAIDPNQIQVAPPNLPVNPDGPGTMLKGPVIVHHPGAGRTAPQPISVIYTAPGVRSSIVRTIPIPAAMLPRPVRHASYGHQRLVLAVIPATAPVISGTRISRLVHRSAGVTVTQTISEKSPQPSGLLEYLVSSGIFAGAITTTFTSLSAAAAILMALATLVPIMRRTLRRHSLFLPSGFIPAIPVPPG